MLNCAGFELELEMQALDTGVVSEACLPSFVACELELVFRKLFSLPPPLQTAVWRFEKLSTGLVLRHLKDLERQILFEPLIIGRSALHQNQLTGFPRSILSRHPSHKIIQKQ